MEPAPRRARPAPAASVSQTWPPRWPYLMALWIRFWNSWISSSRWPAICGRSGASLDRDRDLVGLGQRRQRGGGIAHHSCQIDAIRRRDMLVLLDPGQRQQIVDQPAHAPGLHAHDVEEFLARLGIVLGVALERVDEAGDRGQRRAQLVAGIGDEIGPRLLGPLACRQIVEQQRGHLRRLGGAADMGLVIAFHRHMHREFDRGRLAGGRRASRPPATRPACGTRPRHASSAHRARQPRAWRDWRTTTRPDGSSNRMGSGRCSKISRGGRRQRSGHRRRRTARRCCRGSCRPRRQQRRGQADQGRPAPARTRARSARRAGHEPARGQTRRQQATMRADSPSSPPLPSCLARETPRDSLSLYARAALRAQASSKIQRRRPPRGPRDA